MYKNIFINQANNRFTNSMIHSNFNVVHANIRNNIYDIFYKFDLDTFIFNLSTLDNSISQFIQEFSTTKNIYLYIDMDHTKSNYSISSFNNIRYIIPESLKIDFVMDHIIFSNNVINTNIFYLDDTITVQKDTISSFLDSIETLPEDLQLHLYPNGNKKIKLYNNPNINHYQNLGVLQEKDKNIVLNESEYFININNHYVFEAMHVGCKILNTNLQDDTTLETKEIITIENFIEQHIL